MFISVVIIITASCVAIDKIFFSKKKTENFSQVKSYSSPDDQLKNNLNTLNDKREYAVALSTQEKYSDAYKLYKEILDQSKSASDAYNLLNFCNIKLSDSEKAKCYEIAKPILVQNIDKLPFPEAYSSGLILEKYGDKTTAKELLQRALNVYDDKETKTGASIMSREDLKNHIEVL